jgi:hypothetical protein
LPAKKPNTPPITKPPSAETVTAMKILWIVMSAEHHYRTIPHIATGCGEVAELAIPLAAPSRAELVPFNILSDCTWPRPGGPVGPAAVRLRRDAVFSFRLIDAYRGWSRVSSS